MCRPVLVSGLWLRCRFSSGQILLVLRWPNPGRFRTAVSKTITHQRGGRNRFRHDFSFSQWIPLSARGCALDMRGQWVCEGAVPERGRSRSNNNRNGGQVDRPRRVTAYAVITISGSTIGNTVTPGRVGRPAGSMPTPQVPEQVRDVIRDPARRDPRPSTTGAPPRERRPVRRVPGCSRRPLPSEYEFAEPLTEFAPVPEWGFCSSPIPTATGSSSSGCSERRPKQRRAPAPRVPSFGTAISCGRWCRPAGP